jgi:hypothetical protein
MAAPNEIEFSSFLTTMNKLTPEQLEEVFVTLSQNFREHLYSSKDATMNYAAISWRCRQAYNILRHRVPKTPVLHA